VRQEFLTQLNPDINIPTFSFSDLRERIKRTMDNNLTENEWTDFWVREIGRNLGIVSDDDSILKLSDINNYLKSKSLPQAVKVDVSIARETIGKGLLLIFGLSLTKNSAERCCASAAEPPFPQIKTLPPFLIVEKIFLIDKNTSLLSPINFFLISILSKISSKY
jgi:hypothetical protein